MVIIISLLLISSLILVVIQDVNNRMIHISLPIVIFGLCLYINYMSEDLQFTFVGYNCAFIVVNIIGLATYFSIKNGGLINPIDTEIGLGDILFFVAVTPLFDLKHFILFLVLGLICSLLFHLVLQLFKKVKTIPLAGYLSIFLMFHILIKDVLKLNMFL